MRRLVAFVPVLLALSITSCNKEECVTCTVTVTTSGMEAGDGTITSTTEVCGTSGEIADTERAGTTSTTTTMGDMTITTNTKTECN